MSYKIGYLIFLLAVVSTGFASASTHTKNICTNTDTNPSYWQLAATRCADEPGAFLMKVPMNESLAPLAPARPVFVQATHFFESAERKSAEISDRINLDLTACIFIFLMSIAALFLGLKKKIKRWACVLSKDNHGT